MPKPPQSFGEQAARFSLYSPLVVFLIALFTRGNNDQPGVAVSVFSINVLLIVLGFGLGIVALISMRKFGRAQIMVRALLGVLINGVFIFVLLTVTLPLIQTGRMRQRLAGHWQMQSATSGQALTLDITFNPDGTFSLSGSGGAQIISLDGHWIMTSTRIVGVTIDHVTSGDPSAIGRNLGLGTVKEVDDQQLRLGTDHGDELYKRQP